MQTVNSFPYGISGTPVSTGKSIEKFDIIHNMKPYFFLPAAIIGCALAFAGCRKEDPADKYKNQVSVIINDIPYKTDAYLRIPYTLELWEFEKDGLVLERISALDEATLTSLMSIEKAEFPRIYKNPIPAKQLITFDEISSEYISFQIPIALGTPAPTKVIHRFEFRDTVKNEPVIFDGAPFTPRLSETPLLISSPVKGKNWIFINQSSNGYHFDVLFFLRGKIFSPERFAFDNLRFTDDLSNYFVGDPKQNESYLNYRDTLYAIADGKVNYIQDGLPENRGDAMDVTFNKAPEMAGNFIVLDIGGGQYAYYCHCVPNSFLVKINETVKEGDPMALLGNSGNSTAPHLHFQICDGPDLIYSNGIPFVLKSYTLTGDYTNDPVIYSPKQFSNCFMEQFRIISFD